MTLTIPNIITLFRLLLIPVFLLLFYLPIEGHYLLSAGVFFLAAATDALDGYLARKLKQSTRFGAFLDPVVDKVMVVSTLVVLVEEYNVFWLSIPAVIMISREIIISALREWMAEIGKRSQVAVSTLGKYKTAAQMLALMGLLSHYNEWIIDISYVFLYLATLFTFLSMFIYLKAAWADLMHDSQVK